MKNDYQVYLDVEDLRSRGWTDALIHRFLGAPDRFEPVDHFRNFTGKRVYFLERIELAEASKDFAAAFKASVRRRKLGIDAVAAFDASRASTAGRLQAWRESLTGLDVKLHLIAQAAAEQLQEAYRRGYKTPHEA